MNNMFADIAPDDTAAPTAAPAATAAGTSANAAAPTPTTPTGASNPFADIGMDDGEVSVDQSGKGDLQRPKYSMTDTALYQGSMGINPFANEIAGGIEGVIRGVQDPMNFGQRFSEGYGDIMRSSKVVSERTHEDNPVTSNLAYFGGALASTPFGGRYVAAAKSLPSMALRAGAVGAAQQGLYDMGEGDADTIGGRVSDTLSGAKTGALLGAGIPLGIGAIRTTGRLISGATRPADEILSSMSGAHARSTAERRVTGALVADRRLEEEMIDSLLSQKVAKARLDGVPFDVNVLKREAEAEVLDAVPRMKSDDFVAARDAGQMPIAADLGAANLRGLAADAAAADRSAAARLKGASLARSRNVAERMRDFVSRSVLPEFAGDEAGVAETVQRLKQAARAQNAHRYAAADAHPNASSMWNERLAKLSEAPAMWQAMQDVVKRSGNVAATFGEQSIRHPFGIDEAGRVFTKDPSVAPNLAFFDRVKRGLNDQANSLYSAGRKDEAAEVGALRDALRDELDTLVPDYKHARSGAAAAFGAEDALTAGRKFAGNMDSMRTSELQLHLSNLSEAEKKLAAHGFVEEVINKIRNGGSIDFLDRPGMREKVNLMVGGSSNGQKLQGFLFRERAVRNFAKAAEADQTLGRQLAEGSKTMEAVVNTLLMSTMTGGFDLSDVALGGGAMLGRRALGRRLAAGGKAKINQEIAKILTETDPTRLQGLLDKASKSSELTGALKAVALASDKLALAGARAGSAEQQAVERVDPQLGFINAQPVQGYAGGGSVPKPVPRPMIVGNIDLNTRPRVRNEDGSISTVRSMSYGLDDGREVLIPTVSDEGEILQPDDAIRYWGAKGQHLGVFGSPAAADEYARHLHDAQARMLEEPEQGYAAGGLVQRNDPNAAIGLTLDGLDDETVELVHRRAQAKGTTPEIELAKLMGLRVAKPRPSVGPNGASATERRARAERSGGVQHFAKGGHVKAAADSQGGREPQVRGLPRKQAEPAVRPPEGRGGASGGPAFDSGPPVKGPSKIKSVASSRRGGSDRSRTRARPERLRGQQAQPGFDGRFFVAELERELLRRMAMAQEAAGLPVEGLAVTAPDVNIEGEGR